MAAEIVATGQDLDFEGVDVISNNSYYKLECEKDPKGITNEDSDFGWSQSTYKWYRS